MLRQVMPAVPLEEGPIVMVDDNHGDIFFVEQSVASSKLQFPFISFSNGADFLAYLARVKAGNEAMPALVLLDLNMPRMNGLEVLERTRSDPAFAVKPSICVFTSSDDQRDRERAQRLGANDYYRKNSSLAEYVAFFDALATGAPRP